MKPIGILGGGQLARMIAMAAHPLGLRCRVLDPGADPPAAAVAEHVRGEYCDPEALARFADGLHIATCEIEHVPGVALDTVARSVEVRPRVEAIKLAGDRLTEKTFLQNVGIATADFVQVDDKDDLDRAIARLGFPLVLKTRTLGFDGRGQVFVRSHEDADEARTRLGDGALIAESWVNFDRELSIVAVRSHVGEVKLYPVIENRHREGILRFSLAPAPDVGVALRDRADAIARTLLLSMDYVGVLVVEMFQVGEQLLVNEIAPRVHNSAHWTIEGSDTSQFENHLRAILGLPLGSTTARGSWVMFNLLGGAPNIAQVMEVPGSHLHLYSKAPRPGRKLGHVTCRVESPATAQPRLQALLGLT